VKRLFTHYLYLLLLLPILISLISCVVFINIGDAGTWGVNKTVGWAWDITNSVFLQFFLYPIYLLGYIILALFRVRTDYKFSLGHVGLIVIPMFIIGNSNLAIVSFYLTVFSFLIFVINLIYSIRQSLINQQR
jgi:hypothetical protein